MHWYEIAGLVAFGIAGLACALMMGYVTYVSLKDYGKLCDQMRKSGVAPPPPQFPW
jgi:hypothetical protein